MSVGVIWCMCVFVGCDWVYECGGEWVYECGGDWVYEWVCVPPNLKFARTINVNFRKIHF